MEIESTGVVSRETAPDYHKRETVSSMTMPSGMYDFYLIRTLNDSGTSIW